MTEPVIQHVSETAFWVAHHRGLESTSPQPLFSDPLAARLAGERGAQIAQQMGGAKMTSWTVAIRTHIIDRYIMQAIERGVDTIVNLGAGLDTRPYRMNLPASLRWIEVDYPDVIDYKEQRLQSEAPRCRLERIRLDLADAPARRELFARLDREAARLQVLTEGVVPYLDVPAAGALADDLHAIGHLESWIIDYISKESIAYRKRKGMNRALGNAAFKFEPADWFGFFSEHGFRQREVRYLAVEGAALGRRAPLPWTIRAVMKLLGPFTPAAKKQGFARFAGYVLLEPKPLS